MAVVQEFTNANALYAEKFQARGLGSLALPPSRKVCTFVSSQKNCYAHPLVVNCWYVPIYLEYINHQHSIPDSETQNVSDMHGCSDRVSSTPQKKAIV